MALESEVKPALDLLKTVPFVLYLSAADGTTAKTCIASSQDLLKSGEIPNVALSKVRELCKLPSKYHFCFHDDINEVSEAISLGIYVPSMKENVAALRDADTDKMSATLTVYYRSRAAAGEIGDPQSSSTQPSEMTENEWNVVLLNNSLLHGLIFDPESKTFKPAREPAFKLKNRYEDRYSHPAGYSTTIRHLYSTNGDEFPVPDFRVVDDSSVTFTEVKNSVQQSMIDQSFSSWSVEASASGGFGGFSGGAKASGGQTSEDINKAAQETTMDLLHASYNFPRIEVILDAIDLELSDSCKAFTKGQPIDVVGFYKKFGTIFSTSVTLGARLHSTVQTSSFMKVTEHTTKDEKKASFSLSFSSPFASAEAGGSRAISSEQTATGTVTNYTKNLNWEARGGETFLATDANAWVNTVGFYQNWRAVDRAGVMNILDLALSMVDGAASFISTYGGGKWKFESGTTYLQGLTFKAQGSGITISMTGGTTFVDVENPVPGSDVRLTSTSAQVWDVRLASTPESFFFCIPDTSRSMMLALDYPSYRNEFVVNPLDAKNPKQIWRMRPMN